MVELITRGGPMMWALLATSVIGVALFLRKAFDLHRAQINWRDFLRGIFNILRRRNIVEAVSMCEETPGPVAGLVRVAILHYDEDRDTIRRAVEEAGLSELPRLEKYMNGIATVAHVAPAMGLLGTLMGMIRMFGVFQQEGPLVHAGDLMGGLGEALYPAAAGLVVGILAFAGYNFLVSRIEAIAADMELAATEIIMFLSRGSSEGDLNL